MIRLIKRTVDNNSKKFACFNLSTLILSIRMLGVSGSFFNLRSKYNEISLFMFNESLFNLNHRVGSYSRNELVQRAQCSCIVGYV